jgi:RNA polymerase sigma factor (sigma-70 family)
MVSDEQLCEQSRAGDREAFGRVVERYQSLICSLAYSSSGSLARSEDLAQETFVTAWQRLGELREPSKLRPWLCAIVRRLSANAARREWRRGGPAESLGAIPEPASAAADPASEAVTQEEESMLWRSLAGLPGTYREPMVLFYRQGQSIAEVAQSLDLSEDAVKQRLARGRALLRDKLVTVVERTLVRTRPTRAFTAAVLAVLPTIGPGATEAALASATATAKGASAAKGLFALVGQWTLLGPVVGLLIGLASSRAAASTGRSPEERACLRRHALQMVLFCWVMSIGLALALVPAGKLYTPSPLGVILGVLAWVVVLVGVILWRCQRIDQEVLRIRAATGTDDASYAEVLTERGSLWPRLPFESKARFLGLPLLAISSMGTDASESPKLRALGWIAVGDTAISPLVAFGGVAIAPLAIGGITIGLASFSLWGIGVGVLAFGSIAIGWWAFGLGALGWQAAAGGAAVAREYALGALASAAETNTVVAKEWFLSQWFVSPVGWFLYSAHWIILAIIVLAFARLFYKSRKLRRLVPHAS